MRSVIVQSKWEEDNRDNSSYYFPGCKKDANCNCQMCLESIHATRDLVPSSTITKHSATKRSVQCTPISFDASLLSTPTSTSFQLSPSTPLFKSSARSDSSKKIEKHHHKGRVSCFGLLKLVLCVGLFFSADLVFPFLVSGVFKPALSTDVVKRVGEKCSKVRDLNGKLRLLQNELARVVGGGVSNCSVTDTLWEINQDGLLLNSRCTLYKSVTEEVTVWGWPLQTAGLLTNGFSSRAFTLLSGRVTQWNDGQISYFVRKANTSWVQPKWCAAAVQLDPNTWVLEYKKSSIFYGTRLHSVALELLKYRISRFVGRLKKDFWLFVAFADSQYNGFTANSELQIPT